MHPQTFFQIIASAALAINGVTADLHDRDVYLRHIAPEQLTRLQKYHTENLRSLNADQTAVLERVKRLVSDYAVHDIHEARAACQASFGPAECKRILNGGDGGSKPARRDALVGRAPTCECADQDPYCDGAQICKYKLSDCNFTNSKYISSDGLVHRK